MGVGSAQLFNLSPNNTFVVQKKCVPCDFIILYKCFYSQRIIFVLASQLGNPRRELNVVSSWQSPPCEEDWDKGELCGSYSDKKRA